MANGAEEAFTGSPGVDLPAGERRWTQKELAAAKGLSDYLDWLEARIDARQGRAAKALAALEQVCLKFADLGMAYDAALATLDLAVLWLEAGNTAKVRELAVEMEAIFRAKKIHREALAALSLFWEAAKREAATVELVRQVIAEIEKAKRSAPGSERPS